MAKRLTLKTHSPLESNVKAWANREGKDYGGGGIEALRSLTEHGCSSGMVGHLVYYNDTTKFYKRHKKEIQKLLKEQMSDFGAKSIKELLRDWDEDDPFAEDTHNQNLLAWYGSGYGVGVEGHRRHRPKKGGLRSVGVESHARRWPDVLPDKPRKTTKRRGGKKRHASGARLIAADKALKAAWG